MADTAWKEVDTTTIRNCWKKSGILPKSTADGPVSAPSVPISSLLNTKPTDTIGTADIKVEKALSSLEQHGVLQCKNWMDIEELLNPANKNKMYADGTKEEEIDQDIEHRKEEQDGEERGNDVVDNNSEVIDQKPSRWEVLNAASVILKYVSDINQPYSRQVESVLASFGCQTRTEEFQNLRSTTLNDYFSRKLK
ncbi:hypothetical protein C0993_003308 [Termitomyces sp. T159_Od127]|nr:hypothetical protein C0993_003308 [Termitomyces sp. T159_Od127]